MHLTLCADDYALSPGVSKGILQALAAGRLNATSVMTNRPSWPEAAAALKPYNGRCEIGLHLNLTCGAPLGPMLQLAPEGHLPNLRRLLVRNLPKEEILAEILRQIDAFIEHFGRPPDYLDGHQHVHVLPTIRGLVFEALEARGLNGKLWLRNCADRLSRILQRRVQIKKALMVAALARGFANEAEQRGYQVNDGFSGFSAFDASCDYGRDFESYLQALGPRHLIMCHPGHVDNELRAVDPVTDSREKELEFLLSDRFGEILARYDLVLGSK